MNFLENNSLKNIVIDTLKKEKSTDMLKRSDVEFSILKYHFTNGDVYLYIDFNKRRALYSLKGTYFSFFKPISTTSKEFIYCISNQIIDCKIMYYKILLKYMEFANVMLTSV